MTTPGFTAEAALGRPAGPYRVAGPPRGARGAGGPIRPAQAFVDVVTLPTSGELVVGRLAEQLQAYVRNLCLANCSRMYNCRLTRPGSLERVRCSLDLIRCVRGCGGSVP